MVGECLAALGRRVGEVGGGLPRTGGFGRRVGVFGACGAGALPATGARRSEAAAPLPPVAGARLGEAVTPGARWGETGAPGARVGEPGAPGARCGEPGATGARCGETGGTGACRGEAGPLPWLAGLCLGEAGTLPLPAAGARRGEAGDPRPPCPGDGGCPRPLARRGADSGGCLGAALGTGAVSAEPKGGLKCEAREPKE
jgi:hypothetical protein